MHSHIREIAARDRGDIFLNIALVCALGINGYWFFKLYWLDADDVMFLQFALDGWRAVFDAVKLYSADQGRVGQLVQMPLNIAASYFFDQPVVRICYIAGYFWSVYAVLSWFDVVARTRAAKVVTLAVIALTPLHFYHLPPTSFPVQNTVPFLLVSLCRVGLLRREGRDAVQKAPFLVGFAFGMTMNEYAFLLGTGMLAIEYLLAITDGAGLRSIMVSRRLWADVGATVASLSIYISYRLAHPSQYDGNSIDGSLSLFGYVWFRHTFGLFSMAIPTGIGAFGTTLSRTVAPLAMAAVVLPGIFVGLRGMQPIRRPLLLGFLAIVFGLYLTFPVAMTQKQQSWCIEMGACYFLDSRSAFVPVMFGFFMLVVGLVQSMTKLAATRQVVIFVVASAVALLSLFTVSQNAWITAFAAPRMAVWKNANQIACTQTVETPAPRELVDPGHLIDVHPHLDPQRFWSLYLKAASSRCR